MALHRDIHWIGRQWAVTGYGMQAIDQRHGGQFDIEIERLWDEDLLEGLSGQKWFNSEDFSKGLAIARKRYPGTPRPAAPEPEPQLEAEPEPQPEFEPELEAEPEPEVEPEPAPPEPALAPLPPPIAPPVPETTVAVPPAPVAEILKPEVLETPPAEPPKQLQAAAPEDLLAKWFEAYGLNKPPSAEPAPEPPRDVVAPAPVEKAPQPSESEPIALVEPALAMELPITASAGPPPPASSNLQMPIPGRARFVRPWRVPIHSIQSYRLSQRLGPP